MESAHTGIVCSLTLTIGGQSVRRFPVFIAPQDVVGDVDVTGRHVVNPLGNSHTAWRGRGTSRSCPCSTPTCAAGWGGAEWEGRRRPVDPGQQREVVSLTDTTRSKQEPSKGTITIYKITDSLLLHVCLLHFVFNSLLFLKLQLSVCLWCQ